MRRLQFEVSGIGLSLDIMPSEALIFHFLVWTPALGAFLLMLNIRRMTRRGEISPSTAASLDSGIALLLLVAYLLMTRLARIAFR